MKWTAKLAVVAALAASAGVVCAWGQDAAVAQSANAVGVVKYSIPPRGGLRCISLPLNPLDEVEWVFGETSLAEQLPKSSTVYFWNTNSLAWDNYTRASRTGAWPADALSHVIARGEAFFVRSPADATEDIVISLLGELPVDAELTYDVTGNDNLDVRAVSMYPVEMPFSHTSLYTNLNKGSTVYFWNTNSLAWDNYTRASRTGSWPSDLVTNRVNVGEGIFIRASGSAVSITNARPFTWDD